MAAGTFRKEPALRNLELRDPGPYKLYGAGDNRIRIHGIIDLPITLGDKVYLTEAIVADIGAAGIIGMNFLRVHRVIANFSAGEFRMGEDTHFLFRSGPMHSFQMRTSRTVVVPPMSEMIIETRPRRPRMPLDGRPCIVQPVSSFAAGTGLVLGGALVMSNPRAMPILVVNPTDAPIVLKRGCIAATAIPAASSRVIPDDPVCRAACATAAAGDDPFTLPDHLESRVPKDRLDEEQRQALRRLLRQYADVFMGPDGAVGKTDVAKHRIDLVDERPLKQRLRRAAIVHQEVIDQEVQKMLDLDIIEPSDSPWASPVVMVKKKDGSWRFCVDYRKLNDATRKDSYPLPHIEDTFDALAGSHYFCALDLASGYWQVEMEESDRAKTAFVTKNGLYQFKVMPFGLCNAPATFERLMEMVLKGFLWKRCMVYIDDVVVYGRSFEETLTNLQMVLHRIRGAGLKLKPSKCELFAQEILYLGFMVTGTGVRPDPAKVAAVQKWPPPCNVADVRSFLGFASYHRRFIRGFAEIARPLTILTEKGADFVWSAEQANAFSGLRQALVVAPVLRHPRPDCEFILDTDASNFALGGVLSQIVDGQERVVAYASVALSRSQMNYCTTHRELLAVVTMTKRFRHYLLGRHFRLRTDHSSLRWLLNYSEADGLVARWLVKLQEYDMQIEHRAGKLHGNADGLSRCHKCKNPGCAGMAPFQQAADSSSDSELDVPGRPQAAAPSNNTAAGASRANLRARTRRYRRGHPAYEAEVRLSSSESSSSPAVYSSWVPSSSGESEYERSLPPVVMAAAAQPDATDEEPNYLGGYSPAQIAAAQRADRALAPVITALEAGQKPSKDERKTYREETLSLVSQWERLSLRDGLLYRRYEPPTPLPPIWQLVLPAELRKEVLHQLHDLRVTGHLGIRRTVHRLQQRFHWPGSSLDVQRWCAACPRCQARKGVPTPGRHPLTTVKAGAPFDWIALDILDTHRVTPRGFRYILVISDYFTKYTDAYPLRRQTADEVARLLVNRWVVYHGVPKQVHSDQGTQFESNLFRNLAQMLGSTKVRTTPYRPQSDGQVERFNRSVLNMLAAFVNDRANDWDDHLPYVLMAYRSSVHSSTGVTPHAMLYGRELNLPVDIMYPTAAETGAVPQCGPEYVEWIRRALANAHDFARARLDKSAIRQKRGYDAHAKGRPAFAEGDKVRYYYPPLKQGNKFAKPWIGPFTVLKQVTDVDYRIRRDSDPDRVLVVHIDNLKKYEGPLVMDPLIQDAEPDDAPVWDPSGQHPRTPDERVRRMVGLPDLSDPSDDGLGGYQPDDGDPQVPPLPPVPADDGRPRRKPRAPARYGWE